MNRLQPPAPDHPALGRYAEIAQILTGQRDSAAEDGLTWVHGLCDAMNVPPLAEYGLTQDSFPALIQKAAVARSTKGNPIELTSEELEQILQRAL